MCRSTHSIGRPNKPFFPLKQCLTVLVSFSFLIQLNAQEDNPYISYDVPFQNLLKFNRFLINPTFSTVREDKSYVNLFHRSQSASFEDNFQNYFLSYSGRINDRTGLGISFYNQQEGVISNIGVLANYAYGVRLSEKSNLTFGVNIPYYRSKLDQERAVTVEQEDPLLNDLNDTSILAVQPGINVSYGNFDFGIFAENLFDFNLKTGESLTSFEEKTFSGHLQFTRNFEQGSGILEDARVMPLARIRLTGMKDINYGGGVILDMPKIGWLQGGYDSYYGGSAGVGFNLNRRLSFGYNFEKGFSQNLENFGVTHEISVAYSFVPNLTENMVNLDQQPDQAQEETRVVRAKSRTKPVKHRRKHNPLYEEIEDLKSQYEENYAILSEIIFRLDSLEQKREKEMEQRFALAVRAMRQEVNSIKDDFQQKLEATYLAAADQTVSDQIDKLNSETKRRLEKKIDSVKNMNQFYVANTSQKVVRKFKNLMGINQGHYIIANVFKTQKYLKNFLKELEDRGLEANYFTHPETGLNYVYLARYEQNLEAYKAYETSMAGSYKEDIWIMHVDNSLSDTRLATLEFEEE